jgi:predicted ribosomally synthesized peptide with SipW-like signal peptide
MKRKLVLSAVLTVTVCLLVGGATFAYFTDQASNTGNTFTAGTVDITARRDMGDPLPGPMFYTTLEEGKTPTGGVPNWPTGLWHPGKSEIRTLIVENTGSLDAYLDGLSAVISNIDDPAIAQEFAGEMDVLVKQQTAPSLVLYDGPLSGLISGKAPALNKIPISAGGVWNLDFKVTMHKDAGNNLQGLVPKVAFSVYAIQKANLP